MHYSLGHRFIFLEGEWKIDKSKNTFTTGISFCLFLYNEGVMAKLKEYVLIARKFSIRLCQKKLKQVMPSMYPSLVKRGSALRVGATKEKHEC